MYHIGKSEAALELIRRGHRLVTDDVVEIRKVSDDTLIGSAPEMLNAYVPMLTPPRPSGQNIIYLSSSSLFFARELCTRA